MAAGVIWGRVNYPERCSVNKHQSVKISDSSKSPMKDASTHFRKIEKPSGSSRFQESRIGICEFIGVSQDQEQELIVFPIIKNVNCENSLNSMF